MDVPKPKAPVMKTVPPVQKKQVPPVKKRPAKPKEKKKFVRPEHLTQRLSNNEVLLNLKKKLEK